MVFLPSTRHLLRAKDRIDARYRDPLDIPTLAHVAHLSPAHFSREFRRTFGETPHQYLLTRRLERVTALLGNTDHSVAEICFAVGLTSVGSFTTSFRRVYGMSPTDYRAAHPPVERARASQRASSRPTRARTTAVFEKTGAWRAANVAADVDIRLEDEMLKQLTHVQVWVHDQDEALAFYTEKLGMELREDVTVPEMGNFRWLSVGVPGQQDVAITLMAIPGPPVFDEETRQQIHTLLAKGASGGLFFSTDDAQKTYEDLKSRGVEFTQEPSEQPYGIDAGFRDVSGNHFRMAQQPQQ
jgi:AraC-like DNA-binding protein/catechol 2,3-dioxygenase-like lactoylglutathione lyase family enzyme